MLPKNSRTLICTEAGTSIILFVVLLNLQCVVVVKISVC